MTNAGRQPNGPIRPRFEVGQVGMLGNKIIIEPAPEAPPQFLTARPLVVVVRFRLRAHDLFLWPDPDLRGFLRELVAASLNLAFGPAIIALKFARQHDVTLRVSLTLLLAGMIPKLQIVGAQRQISWAMQPISMNGLCIGAKRLNPRIVQRLR